MSSNLENAEVDLDAELREAQDNGYTPTAQMIVYLIRRLKDEQELRDIDAEAYLKLQAHDRELSAQLAQIAHDRGFQVTP